MHIRLYKEPQIFSYAKVLKDKTYTLKQILFKDKLMKKFTEYGFA